jgi:hypothetical protein
MDATFGASGLVGWIAALLCVGALCGGYFIYGLLRQHRYRRPRGPGFSARVQGRLVGRIGSLPYRTQGGELQRADEVLLVQAEDRSIPVLVGTGARGARAGCFVIADGSPVTLIRDQPLHREPTNEPALLAGKLIVGSWPELHWLRLPVAIGCLIWLLGLACWLFEGKPVGPFGRLFDRRPVENVLPLAR